MRMLQLKFHCVLTLKAVHSSKDAIMHPSMATNTQNIGRSPQEIKYRGLLHYSNVAQGPWFNFTQTAQHGKQTRRALRFRMGQLCY